ncbi:MAG: 50S ribosomal protein L17 [Dehalococcoidia bacterium]|nr:50S ribosomal protein L17 [Dehalococcoidia bacterium]
MRHRVAGRHLGRETSHRLSLYRNLVTDLLRYERITTTEAKAKEIRPMAERIITLGRKGDLHSRRQALRFVYDPKVVKKVFDVIGPRMATRPGGYLRITGLEPRKGDGARMATIELVDVVDAPPTPRPQRVTAAPSARAAAPAAAAPVAAPKVEEAEEVVEETTAEVVEEAAAVAEPAAEDAAEEAPAESEEDKGAEA